MKKEKGFLFGLLTTFSLVVVGTAGLSLSNGNNVFSSVAGEEYVLNLDRSVTAGEITAGQASFNTSSGSAIAFKFDSSKASTDSGLISLATGGNFYNETAITGMSKVVLTLASGSATLSYGSAKESLYNGSQALSGTSPITVNFAGPSDYFRIDDVTGPLAISSLRITYACSNTYAYEHTKEAASDDLLYSSTLEHSFSWAYVPDTECLDVANSNSGLSFHLTISSGADGWPVWKFNLGSAIGASEYDIEFYAKGIGHTDYNFMLLDGSDNNILNANRAISVSESWQKITLSNLTAAAGKSLADVQKIKMSANFGTSKGSERHLYIDELHVLVPETPTRNNLEMVNYSKADNQHATAEVCYSDTYGVGSTSSRKLSFANSSTLDSGTAASTWRAFALFNVATSLGADNGIDSKNCTLSFDLKFSTELVNAEDTRKGSVTVEITDGNGTTASYFQVSFTMQDGWIHASRNLSGVGQLSGLDGNVQKIKLGFYGVYSGNRATATIIIDNFALTANA